GDDAIHIHLETSSHLQTNQKKDQNDGKPDQLQFDGKKITLLISMRDNKLGSPTDQTSQSG
ncbi:hypothetical protein MKW98_024283, partial [Papaver atlanticum]